MDIAEPEADVGYWIQSGRKDYFAQRGSGPNYCNATIRRPNGSWIPPELVADRDTRGKILLDPVPHCHSRAIPREIALLDVVVFVLLEASADATRRRDERAVVAGDLAASHFLLDSVAPPSTTVDDVG